MGKFTITVTTEGDCIITNPPSECVITSILDIADNVPNDSGEYVCAAINDAGNNTASVSLTVNGKHFSHRATYVFVYCLVVFQILNKLNVHSSCSIISLSNVISVLS